VETGGQLGQKVSEPSTESSELVGIIAAMVILTFTFGTVVAMLLPILTAIFALTTTLSIARLLGHVLTVPTVAPTVATIIGLGVGIDYAAALRHTRISPPGSRANCHSRSLVVIALSFVLLILAFRTVIVPPQAALMNLLSIGASYAVLTAIFQYGWLSGVIGLSGPVPIVSYVPRFIVRDPVWAVDGLRGVPGQPDRGARPRRGGQPRLGRLGAGHPPPRLVASPLLQSLRNMAALAVWTTNAGITAGGRRGGDGAVCGSGQGARTSASGNTHAAVCDTLSTCVASGWIPS
jgi:hypothetical protein